jgi:hypothetical protein
VLARTSVPPCFSVMPMPSVRPALSTGALFDWSYLREVMRGAHSRNAFGLAISAASEALVMVIGHRCPHSSSEVRKKRAARIWWRLPVSASPFSQIEE